MAGAINTVYSAGGRRRASPGASRSSSAACSGFVVGLPAPLSRRDAGVQGAVGAARARARAAAQDGASRAPRRETLLALALTWVLTAGIVVVILFTPTYLQQVLPRSGALRAAGQQRARRSTLGDRLPGVRLGERSRRHARDDDRRIRRPAGAPATCSTRRCPTRRSSSISDVRPHRLLRRRRDDGADRRGAIRSRRPCASRACRSPTTCRTRSSAG